MKKFKRAFTIVELVIVIAVVAILAAVLIPTISSVVDNANLSSDEQVAVNLTKQIKISLATNEINDESDIWNILEETYGENYAEALVAKSKGNNFWYDIEKKEVFVGDENTLASRKTDPTRVKFNKIANSKFDMSSLRVFDDRFLFLDHGNNGFAQLFKNFDEMSNDEKYLNAINAVIEYQNNENSGLARSLFNKLCNTVIFNDYGVFRTNNPSTNSYFKNGITTISSVLYVYNGNYTLGEDLLLHRLAITVPQDERKRITRFENLYLSDKTYGLYTYYKYDAEDLNNIEKWSEGEKGSSSYTQYYLHPQSNKDPIVNAKPTLFVETCRVIFSYPGYNESRFEQMKGGGIVILKD